MHFKNFKFNQKPKLLINKKEYIAERIINGTFHIFNKSWIDFKGVWYADGRDRLENSLYFKEFSLVELYYGTDLAFFGIIKGHTGATLDPNKPKALNIKAIDFKEWLIHKPMDFIIYRKSPSWVVEEVIKTLSEKRITLGKLQFTNTQEIIAYNTKDKSAYDVLRMIEKKTQSILQILPNDKGELEISFFTESSLKKTRIGAELDLSDKVKAQSFYDTYTVTKLDVQEDSSKLANQVRIESERAQYQGKTGHKIDLSSNRAVYNTLRPIGKIDKTSAILTTHVPSSGNLPITRKLVVVTKQKASKGKVYDISYSHESDTIGIGKHLQGINGVISFDYYALGRISYQFKDQTSQNEIAVRSDSNGILHNHQKHNDETSPSDMISLGKGYLIKNNKSRASLMVESRKPIWDLGENTKMNSYILPDINGTFIVYKAQISQIIYETGEIASIFKYELINTLDFEDQINALDSQQYRDHPIFDTADVTFDSRTDYDEKVFLIVENFQCEPMGANPKYPVIGGV